jgi:sugar/nucleoside kinase (ribokinase family)
VLAGDEHLTTPLAAQTIPRGPRSAPETLADRLREFARNVIIKLGPDGAIWAGPHGLVGAAAPPATIVDSTGAGDAFAAGFLSAWLAGAEPAAVLQRAVAFGTAAVETTGGRPVSPRRA